jgi:hypothetical protein
MHVAIRRLPAAAIAVAASALLVACGGSGAGLIPTANAGPLEHDFEEVARQAHAGNCTGTKEALEKTEADFANVSARIDFTLRRKLQEGIEHLHSQALEECSHATTTTSTTVTTKTHVETLAPVTTTTVVTTAAPPTTSGSNGGEEAPGGGGTQAPGDEREGGSPGGAEAQGGQPGEGGGGAGFGGGR